MNVKTLISAAAVAATLLSAADALERPLVNIAFDEATGAYADDPDSGRTATLTPSAKWATGTFGGALATGETGAAAVLEPIAELEGAEECTVFLRFRRNGAGVGKYPCLLSTGGWGSGGMLLFSDGKTLNVRLRAGSKGPEGSWQAFARIPERKWSSVALVFRRPDVTVYADGKAVSKGKWNHPFRAGGRICLGGWTGDSFGGFIDDFRVWKAALGADAIAGLAADSRHAEVEGYQDDGTGGIQKTEVVGQGGQPLVTLAGDAATATFDTLGNLSSLRENATGRELVSNAMPFVQATLDGGRHLGARRLQKRGEGRMAWLFPGSMGEVEMSVVPFKGGWRFNVERCSVKGVKALEFCRVRPACAKWIGNFANACSDERSAVCVRSCDLEGEPKVNDGILRVSVAEPFAPQGRAAVLAAGPREGFREQLKAMTVAAGAPRSDCGGAWSMGSEVSRWSYVFASVQNGDVDYWIDFVRRGGFANIHNQSWTSLLGPYPIRKGAFPGGLEGMKAGMDKVHAAGLHAGIHTLTACINPHAEWISPVCSTDLVADATYTLAAPLGEKDTELLVNERPIDRHSTVFTYSSNGNVLRIGNELLQYDGIRREGPPYAFTGLKRGAFGTRKGGAIPAGAKADYVHQRYIAFYPKPGSQLAEKLADRLAEVYNTCNLDEFYFDGSEGMGTRYGVDFMRHLIYSKLKPNNGHSPSIEASCGNANNWWFQTRMATVDHPTYAVKRFHDWHLKWAIDNGRLSNFLEPQMGWWQPRTDVPRARGHMLDEMEYFAGKNAGHDAAMSIQGVTARPLPFGVRSQLTLLGWYEYPRLARAFTPDAVERLAGPRTEARLRQSGKGVWELTDVETFVRRFGFAWDRRWQLESASERPAAMRVEALYAAGPDVDGETLLKGADFLAMKKNAASGMEAALATDVKTEHGPAFRLSATNRKAEQNASWAEARHRFAFPGADVGADRIAFGAWVKGDGSGALLSMTMATPAEYHLGITAHHIRLDFTGWRYVTALLRERDTEEHTRYRWPFGGSYSMHRTFLNPQHVGTFAACLNDIPEGRSASVEIGEVRALTMVSNRLENAAVKVNGRDFRLPFAMDAGEYAELDGGAWTRFSALGLPLESVPAEGDAPMLAEGRNEVELVGGDAARAEVTFFALGRTRPAFVDDLTADMRRTMRFEGMMPFAYAPKKGLEAPAEIAVRPGEEATISLEIYGPAENPTLTFSRFFGLSKTVCAFSTAIGADERLVCRDGHAWRLEKAKNGALVREGALETPLPTLGGGSNPFSFEAQVPDGASCAVDILKAYR